jgi:hypothetical protein
MSLISVHMPSSMLGAQGAPAIPTGVSATVGTGQATVSWTAPAQGQSPITSYTVTPYLNGVIAQTPKVVTGSPPATSTTVTGLTTGANYTFVVTATNAQGQSQPSAPSSSVSPLMAGMMSAQTQSSGGSEPEAPAPSGNNPTAAFAGDPGYFEPEGADLPANIAALRELELDIQPYDAWAEGEHIVIGTGNVFWDGGDWVKGTA